MAGFGKYWQKIVAISLGFLLLLFIAAVFWLGNSQSGLRWVIKQAEAYAPGNLTIARVEGRVFKQITLHDVSFEQTGTLLLQAKKLNFTWHIGSLLERTAYINKIQLEGVKLDLMAPAEPAQDKKQQDHIDIEKLPHIQLPLKIVISKLLLKDFQLSLKQSKAPLQSYTVEQFSIIDIDVEDDFKIESATLSFPAQEKIPQLDLKWSLLASLAPPFKSQIELAWQADFPQGVLPLEHFPEGLAAQGAIDISGDLHQFTIEKKFLEPMQLEVLANINQPLKEINWDSKITWQELHWPLITTADTPKQLLLQKGQLEAQGDLEKYELNLSTQISGKQIPQGDWKINGKGDSKQFSILDLNAQILNGEITSQGDIAWQPQLRAALETRVKGLHLNQLQTEFPINTPLDSFLRFELQDETLKVDQLMVDLPQSGAKIQIDGQVQQLKTEPEANLVVNWQDLKWPLVDGPTVAESSKGKVHVMGGIKGYSVELNSRISGKDIPEGDWEALLNGDQHRLDSFNIVGKLLNGEAKITGSADWQNFPQWRVAVDAKNIQPQLQWPQLPGQLSVNLKTQGQFKEEKLSAHVLIDQLKGKIKGYPIRLKADLNSDGTKHKINHLDFYSGKNHINARAEVVTDEKPENMQINANYSINAPQIGSFLPEAKGQVIGSGTIQGTVMQPKIKADLTAQKIRVNEWRLENLNSNIAFDPEQDGKLNLKLAVQQLLQNNQAKLESLNLTTKGKLTKHRIKLAANTAKENIKMELDGGLDQDSLSWNGYLQKLNLGTDILGQWNLTSASGLSLSQQQASLDNSCLKAEQHVGQVCVELDWLKGQSTRANLDIKQLSISQVADPLLPSHIALTGMIVNGEIKSQIDENELGIKPIDADLNFNITPGNVFTLLEGRQYLLPFKGADLNLAINDNGLNGDIAARVFNNSTIQGKVLLSELNQLPLSQRQPLDIKFSTNFNDLDILPSLSPLLKNTAGQLNLDVTVDGDMSAPNINGQMLLQAKTDIPSMGLELNEISTQIVTDKSYQQLNVDGNIQSGEGFNRFDGKVDLSDIANWQANLKVYGEQFRAIHNNDFKVWLEPDMQLLVQPGQLEIDGKLLIPKAIITPQVNLEAGGGKVSSSSDVVVVDEEQKETAEQPSNWKIKGKLDLLVGDDIKIDVADFKSGMEGKISMLFEPENIIPKGQGELTIVDGTYKAYGQDLEISQGRIFFQGTPMDNPGLGIRAIRRIKNNSFNAVDVAGIDIRGTAKSPRLSLFSEPKVSDADIISYIVTGSAITGGDIESRELTLGKYISPSFYVSLGYDLFEGNKSFNLRYDINKKWGIEGLAGDRDSGVDLSFTLGR